MKSKNLSKKSVSELKKELLELTKEHFNLRMQKGLGESPRPHLYKQVRKNIARVKTFMKQKEGSTE